MYFTVDDLELILQKEGILHYDATVDSLHEAQLNTADYWMASPLP
jgi:hypothetical protein